jgi:adenosylmethionine-8-amino-7-oxononanoate aminotransferase
MLISDRLIAEISGDDVADSYFSNGYTYSGHPVACAAALKNIEIIEREGILEHVREVAPYFQERLRALGDLPIVADIRGEGLIGCIECDITSGGEESLAKDHEIGKRIDAHCHKMGLMLRPMINMCVFSPPCIITRDQIDEMFDILRRGIEATMEDLRKEGLWQG